MVVTSPGWMVEFREHSIWAWNRVRRKQLLMVAAPTVFAFIVVASLFSAPARLHSLPKSVDEGHAEQPLVPPFWAAHSRHPIVELVNEAQRDFGFKKSRQSRTLEEAAGEYRRRYHIPPPPGFDKWYAFAVENDVQFIDEYNIIHDTLQPFWGLSPKAIRDRTRKAIDGDEWLMGIFVRNGTVVNVERGEEWQQDALRGMLEKFVNWLPDMDILFNLHDEARVILPHEDLARHLRIAREVTMPKANGNMMPHNRWSPVPSDTNDGIIEPSSLTRFNDYHYQYTWTESRLSCPVDTPARAMVFEDTPVPDQVDAFAISELGFIRNTTAFRDICLSPSLEDTFGLFNRPNAWSITHDLVPIFTPSKVSSFQDILLPSPWYWADRVFLNQTMDPDWDDKLDVIYWRGTTTSGYSSDGSWRRQHRQRFIEKIERPGISKIMTRNVEDGDIAKSNWTIQGVQQEDYSQLFDVHFTYIGQCAPEDCDIQNEYFDLRDDDDFQDAWRNKYLLDIDGNAFSGRFYTFLQSRSLTFKLALFREWHEEWLQPWAHYIPWSIKGDEHLESLRYLSEDVEGRSLAKQIAGDSSEWANKVLRHVDMEAWLFRLLLE